jgi:hypothetical protein
MSHRLVSLSDLTPGRPGMRQTAATTAAVRCSTADKPLATARLHGANLSESAETAGGKLLFHHSAGFI